MNRSSYYGNTTYINMVKFGLRLSENRSSSYPPEAYMNYDKLKEIINELAGKKLARYVSFVVGL